MKIIRLKDLTARDYQRIIRRSAGNNPDILPKVRKIMEEVRLKRDKYLTAEFKSKYGDVKTDPIKVSGEDIKKAYKEVDREVIESLKQMIKNITLVHEAQLPKKTEKRVSPEKGISVRREWRPIEKIGIYIPGGRAIYPSSVLMSTIPAKIAGCREIVMCSPPRENGQIPAPTLVAADLVGLAKIFKVGGAQAIAAMVYGTDTIPFVYKIFGAGNSYVTAAKMLAQNEIAIDMPAGPSEVFIIADKYANPEFIAADLLADGEHGEDSACVLITTSKEIAKFTIEEIKNQLSKLSTGKRAEVSIRKYGLFAVVDSLQEGIEFINNYAPEHLEIMVKNPEEIVSKIQNAGSVFLGNYTGKATGDYATGANHVLPTGGMAKMFPPLGVEAFGKWMQVQKCSREGLKNIRQTIRTLSEVEKLPAHGVSGEIRFRYL